MASLCLGISLALLIFNSMLGDTENSIKFFRQIQQMGSPDALCYVSMMRAFGVNQAIPKVMQVFDNMIRDRDLEYDSKSFEAVLLCLSRFAPNECEEAFAKLVEVGFVPDENSYLIMIGLFLQRNNQESALQMITRMLDNGIMPSVFFLSLCRKLYACGAYSYIAEVINLFERRNIPLLAQIYAVLIDNLTKKERGNLNSIAEIVSWLNQRKVQRNQVLYHTLVKAYTRGDVDKALRVFNEMKETQFTPWTETYNILIEMYINNGNYEQARWVYMDLKNSGLSPDFGTFEALLKGPVSNAEIRELLVEITQTGLQMTERAYISLIRKFISNKDLGTMWMLFGQMEKDKVVLTPNIMRCVATLFRFHFVDEAHKVLDWITERKVPRKNFSYQILIRAYGLLRDNVRLSQTLHNMQKDQVEPSLVYVYFLCDVKFELTTFAN